MQQITDSLSWTPLKDYAGGPISSRTIRQAIADGEIRAHGSLIFEPDFREFEKIEWWRPIGERNRLSPSSPLTPVLDEHYSPVCLRPFNPYRGHQTGRTRSRLAASIEEPGDWVSAAQAAETLGVELARIIRAIRNGKIPVVRMGHGRFNPDGSHKSQYVFVDLGQTGDYFDGELDLRRQPPTPETVKKRVSTIWQIIHDYTGPDWVSLDEASVLSGISRSQLHTMARNGQIPSQKVHARLVVPRAALSSLTPPRRGRPPSLREASQLAAPTPPRPTPGLAALNGFLGD